MPQNKIYVGNIAYAAELEEIQSLFEPYGTIEDIAMAMDKETEKFRGFAIVMMPNVEEAAKAIAGAAARAAADAARNAASNVARGVLNLLTSPFGGSKPDGTGGSGPKGRFGKR